MARMLDGSRPGIPRGEQPMQIQPRPVSPRNPPTALQARQLTQSPQGMVPRGNLTPGDVRGILAPPAGRVPGGGGARMFPLPTPPIRPIRVSNPGGPGWNPYATSPGTPDVAVPQRYSKGGIVKKGKAQRRDYCK